MSDIDNQTDTSLSNLTVDKLVNLSQEQIKEPHAPIGVFDLPAGVLTPQGELIKQITVREMSGHEEDLLASPKISAIKKVNQLLTNCLIKLGDSEDRKFIESSVKDMLAGDRAFLLMAIRRVTLGDNYTFADKCPNEECKAESLFTINLSDLEAVNIEETSKRFHTLTLPSGKVVKWHFMNGHDEERQQQSAKEDVLSLGLWIRMDLLNDKKPTILDVKGLSQRDRQYLRAAFQAQEPGLDLNLDMQCPVCGLEFQREMDLDPGFFYPSQAPKRSKKRSSS